MFIKMETWIRLKKDEYVFNDKAIEMTPEKIKKIKELDHAVLYDRRFG